MNICHVSGTCQRPEDKYKCPLFSGAYSLAEKRKNREFNMICWSLRLRCYRSKEKGHLTICGGAKKAFRVEGA